MERFENTTSVKRRYGELCGVIYTELYRGGDGAERWFERELPRLSRGFLLKGGLGRGTLLMFRARASLAARNLTSGKRAARLLASAEECTRQLKHVKLRYAAINAISLEAQLAAIRGDIEAALHNAHQVRSRAESRSCFLLVHAIDYFEGTLEGGEAGVQKQRAALGFFADQGWLQPRRAVALLCPVIDTLEAAR